MTASPSSSSSSSRSSPVVPAHLPFMPDPKEKEGEGEEGEGDLIGTTVAYGEACYVLEKLLDAGGMGEVYLATRVMGTGAIQWRTGEHIAVKVVRRDLAARFGGDLKPFLDEAQLLLGLDHPNVVHARGLVDKDRTLYLLMDLLDGWDLRTLLDLAELQGKRLSEGAVCSIVAQVAEALGYIHRATDHEGKPLHIVHRDVSPSNIHVTSAGDVKLLDFGVAYFERKGRLETRSSDDTIKGKLKYLSPEQVRHQKLDGRSDIFSLGTVLAEALTGRNPFEAKREETILHAIEHVAPGRVERALQGIAEGLKAICHRALALKPEDRFSTGREMADALRAYAGVQGHPLHSAAVAREVAALVELALAREARPPSSAPTAAPLEEKVDALEEKAGARESKLLQEIGRLGRFSRRHVAISAGVAAVVVAVSLAHAIKPPVASKVIVIQPGGQGSSPMGYEVEDLVALSQWGEKEPIDRPVPLGTLPGQKVAPCNVEAGQEAIYGNCWTPIAKVKPPCRGGLFRHGDFCYMAIAANPKKPVEPGPDR